MRKLLETPQRAVVVECARDAEWSLLLYPGMRAPGLTRARQTPRVFLVHHSCNGAHALAPQNTTVAACLLPTSGDPRGAASGFDPGNIQLGLFFGSNLYGVL
jgi:hypothetical protein